MSRIQWGVLGLGRIAGRFAKGLETSHTGQLARSASRDPERAAKFGAEYGGGPSPGYQELLDDPAVQAVYIALPHHLHEEWTIRAAQAGKHILCEKPFTLDLPSAERAIQAVQSAGVFFAEAFMYRFHPQTLTLKQKVREGVIGELQHIAAEFGFRAGEDWNNFRTRRQQGGGGLMDVGAFCVSLTRLMMGNEPTECHYRFRATGDGYDGLGVGTMAFPGERLSTFSTGIHLNLRNQVTLHGTEGRIEIDQPWFCNGEVRLIRGGETELITYESGDLYAYEIDALAESVAAGRTEHPAMNHADSLGQAATLDALRASAGLSWN